MKSYTTMLNVVLDFNMHSFAVRVFWKWIRVFYVHWIKLIVVISIVKYRFCWIFCICQTRCYLILCFFFQSLFSGIKHGNQLRKVCLKKLLSVTYLEYVKYVILFHFLVIILMQHAHSRTDSVTKTDRQPFASVKPIYFPEVA